MAQQLKELAALPKDQKSVPSTLIKWLTLNWSSSLFWPPRAPSHMWHTHRYTHTHTEREGVHINKNKPLKGAEEIIKYMLRKKSKPEL